MLVSWTLGALAGPLPAPDPQQERIREDFREFAEKYPRFASPLDSDDFRHPAEVEMIETLMTGNPGIRDQIDPVKQDQARQVREKTRLYRLHAVEVGPSQYPRIHEAAQEAAAVLGLHDDFTIVVTNNAEMSEDVMGIPRHGHIGNSFSPFTIVLTSGLVKALSDDELRFVLGRQMGHVKANHRFYTNLAFAWQQESGKLPRLFPDEEAKDAPGVGGTMQLFFERGPGARRISEFSADRAGLLVTQDLSTAVSMLAKMARGDLEDEAGFSLEAYIDQVREAARTLKPQDLEEVVGEQGFMPYLLTRVGELAAFSKSEEYQRLVDRTTDRPFLLELEVQERIEAARRYFVERLEGFRSSPRYTRTDPLARASIEAGLRERIDARTAASAELSGLIVAHVEAAGLETPNPLFDELTGLVQRRQDARSFGVVFSDLGDALRFRLSQPDLDPPARVELESKLARIGEVQDLAPPPPSDDEDGARSSTWFEDEDLPALFNETVERLRAAAGSGGKEAFLAELVKMKPELRAEAIELLGRFSNQEKGEMAQMLSAHGGRISEAVGRVLAAGDDPERLDRLFDEYFEVARKYLRWVPMFVIRSRLARVAKLDV